jgi:heme/copper-type cytochrome/quinol oxidase subunit 2
MGSMFLPLGRRAALAKQLLVVAVVVHCFALVVDFGQLALVQQIQSRTATIADVRANDSRQALVGLVSLAAYAVAAVAFVAWFHRAYANATRLGATGLRHRTSLAIFAWFIPILALFWPKEIADDTWKATDPDLPAEAGDRWRDAKAPAIFACWWLAWIATNVLSLMSRRLNGDTISALRVETFLALGRDGLGVTAGILAIVVVNALSQRQEARAARLAVAIA